MAVRPKTKRRLFILLAGMMGLTALTAGLWAISEQRSARRIAKHHATGLAAFENGEFATATHALRKYLNHHPEDLEALYRFAAACRKAPLPQGKHLIQAMRAYRRLLVLNPEHLEARRDLVDLYIPLGYDAEAIDQANILLERDPEDTIALKAKTVALTRKRQFDDDQSDVALTKGALVVAEAYCKLKPLDLEGQLRLFDVLNLNGENASALLKRARALIDEYPQAPSPKLLLGIAYQHANDPVEAIKWYLQAADGDAPDASFVLHLTNRLALLGRPTRALAELQEHAATMDDPGLQSALVHRLWENNRQDEILKQLADLKPTPGTDSEILGLKAAALLAKRRPDEAEPIIEALAARAQDPTASAWLAILQALAKPEAGSNPADLIVACQKAVARRPDHPYFRFWLAEAYAKAGELELALQAWGASVDPQRNVPFWVIPRLRMARAFMAIGQPGNASKVALTAVKLAPRNLAVGIVLAEAWDAAVQLGKDDPQQLRDRLKQLVDIIQANNPGEPTTAAIAIKLMADNGQQEEARKALRAALDATPTPSSAMMLKLADISRRKGLGLAELCLERCEQEYGVDPELDFSKAVLRLDAGESQQGLAELERAAVDRGASEQWQWRLARARYLEEMALREQHADKADKQPLKDLQRSARDLWISVADELVDNAKIQRMALQAKSTWSDAEFIDRAVTRVRQLVGDEAITWRLPRARWLLGDGTDARKISAALKLLKRVTEVAPQLIEARALLAQCYKLQNNPSAAVGELRIVLQRRPGSVSTALELAELLRAQGNDREARRLVQRIADTASASSAQRRHLARMLMRDGSLVTAAEVLKSTSEGATSGATVSTNLLLAEIYRRSNDIAAAEAIYVALLKEPSAPVIAAAARFYGTSQRHEEVQQVLSRLDQLDLEAGQAELVRAQYFTAVDRDKARQHFQAATRADPKRALYWHYLIAFHLSMGDQDEARDDALATVVDGLVNCREDETLRLLQASADLIRGTWQGPGVRQILASLVLVPATQAASLKVLEILSDLPTMSVPDAAALKALQQVADDSTRFLALQLLMAQVYRAVSLHQASEGMTREAEEMINRAADVALRAMQKYPNAAEPAWMAADYLAEANRLTEALRAARAWRQIISYQPEAADTTIADILVRLNRPVEARSQIEPLIGAALEDPDSHMRLIVGHALALIAGGEAEDAASLLEALLPRSAQWRFYWIRLTYLALSDAASASDWLNRVTEHIPPDADLERANLATAWRALDEKFHIPAYTDTARKILTELVADPQAPPRAVFRLAVMNDADGHDAAAATGYRRFIAIKQIRERPMALAMNNLAMILLQQEGSLVEALDLAQRAVAAQPRSATLHDTLAAIQAKRGNLQQAAREAQAAIDLQPKNLKWQLALGEFLLKNGKLDEAEDTLKGIDRILADRNLAKESLRDRLDSLRSGVLKALRSVEN